MTADDCREGMARKSGAQDQRGLPLTGKHRGARGHWDLALCSFSLDSEPASPLTVPSFRPARVSREAHTPQRGAAGHPPRFPGGSLPGNRPALRPEGISHQLEPGDNLSWRGHWLAFNLYLHPPKKRRDPHGAYRVMETACKKQTCDRVWLFCDTTWKPLSVMLFGHLKGAFTSHRC